MDVALGKPFVDDGRYAGLGIWGIWEGLIFCVTVGCGVQIVCLGSQRRSKKNLVYHFDSVLQARYRWYKSMIFKEISKEGLHSCVSLLHFSLITLSTLPIVQLQYFICLIILTITSASQINNFNAQVSQNRIKSVFGSKSRLNLRSLIFIQVLFRKRTPLFGTAPLRITGNIRNIPGLREIMDLSAIT